jgi:hypothetical protein
VAEKKAVDSRGHWVGFRVTDAERERLNRSAAAYGLRRSEALRLKLGLSGRTSDKRRTDADAE